jgi:tRNA-dihydrouridine synthase B
MAGITDLSLRVLAKNGGAGLVYTEMISSRALIHSNKKTRKLLKISSEERPIAVQIFGGDVYSMSEASRIVRDMGADIIDINLGCPVKKIVKFGAGVNLLTNEKLVSEILNSVVKSVDIPVSIKTRIGLFPGQNIVPEIIKIAQDCGVRMIVIHSRPASCGHSGIPDLKSFMYACKTAKIPIVANGGIVDEKTANDFLQIPNCAGIMIGRGALGNYSIFKRLEEFFNNNKPFSLPLKWEKIEWLKKHVEYSIKNHGEKMGFILVRKVVNYYIKDFLNAAKIRNTFNKIVKISDFNEWQNSFKH